MKNNRTMRRATIVLAALACMLMMLTACGGDSLVGKWYVVSEKPSEAEYENMEFKGDGTVICEDVEGSYDDSGEEIYCNILGTEFTCTWDTVDGHKVLYSDWKGNYYAKSVEEAEEVRDALNDGAGSDSAAEAEEEGTDSVEGESQDPMKYDETLAAEEGGLFVKSGEEYSRLAPPTQTTEYSFPGALLFGDENGYIAELGKDDQLVLFSESAPEETAYICKIAKTGKTFPFYTTSSGEAKAFIDGDSDGEYETIDIEEIDGKGIEEYTKGMTKYYEESYGSDYYLKECKGDEKATVGYHEGTKYLEETVTPDLFYYMLGSDIEESVTLGKASYATISTSNLKNGIYAIYDNHSDSTVMLSVKR